MLARRAESEVRRSRSRGLPSRQCGRSDPVLSTVARSATLREPGSPVPADRPSRDAPTIHWPKSRAECHPEPACHGSSPPLATGGWSVVIPAYNEAARLPRYLREVVSYFDGRDQPYEVLVVDDGSVDDTASGVLEASREHPSVGLVTFPTNHGKRRAVKAGMQLAVGALRLMADADGATPIGEVKRLEAALLGGVDVAVGSRARPDPSVLRQTHLHRRMAGFVFNLMAKGLGVGDVM